MFRNIKKMPYIKGMGYLKRNGRVSRSTMVRSRSAKPVKMRSGGLFLRGPGATVYLNKKSFVPTRNLLRRYMKF